ncbi:lipoprotein-releasing ABC transporter permease subunit [Simiduia sp. 21SJ11W-1]|uniref:lipoprotein-releasing ABC transporter permease subunit n=1 Tax=Simiduia sp. 21SJ11W-1 TaxID=2909669 RepID=UPI00209D1D8D|nr:lipoprotein-releasing ABC transporter permease subunit [Simiduia sp. 21SJ11W-1]UTA49408.1 lipoprotein-releasing ABC transporter permease subunit [Simiduia sp. 21SJ11W-1]
MKSMPLFIGLRYIRARRRNQFISFLSGFAMLGMLLGVGALVIVLSVMNGFDRELKGRLLAAIPHGLIAEPAGTRDWVALAERIKHPDILATAPYVEGFAMLGFGRSLQAVEFNGIEPALEGAVSDIADHMVMGQLDSLAPGTYGVVLGRILARQLGVVPGDKIMMTLPQLNVTPAGIFPRVKRFTLVGVFEVGAQVDQSLVLMHLEDAQKLLRMGANVDGVRVRVSDMFNAQTVLQDVRNQLGGTVEVRSWMQTQGSLFQAIKMEKTVITVLLLIIVLVAAFNIVTSLILMVADKRADIAVLRTLGITAREVMAIFMVQGSAVGMIGIVGGALLGSLIGIYIGPIVQYLESLTGLYVFDPSVYFISHLPSHWQWQDVALVASVGALLSVLASLYPAYRASKVEPAETLRYE